MSLYLILSFDNIYINYIDRANLEKMIINVLLQYFDVAIRHPNFRLPLEHKSQILPRNQAVL